MVLSTLMILSTAELSLRIRDCLTQLYAKDITPDDKQELDEALQREVCRCQLVWIHFVLSGFRTIFL